MGKWNEGKEVSKSEAPAEGAAEASKGRKVMLKDPSTGNEIARVDVIKALFAQGMKRAEIRKTLETTYGHKVPYQIVFAATKQPKVAGETAPAAEAAA